MKLYTVTALNPNNKKVYLTNCNGVYFTPDRNELVEMVNDWENNQQTQDFGHFQSLTNYDIVEVEI